jgi:hypothetical protein
MSLAAEMLQAVSSYRKGDISLGQFEDWFRDNSRGMFGESPDVLEMCLSIDAAFSELRYGALPRESFDEELASAIFPFEAKEESTQEPISGSMSSSNPSYPEPVSFLSLFRDWIPDRLSATAPLRIVAHVGR